MKRWLLEALQAVEVFPQNCAPWMSTAPLLRSFLSNKSSAIRVRYVSGFRPYPPFSSVSTAQTSEDINDLLPTLYELENCTINIAFYQF